MMVAQRVIQSQMTKDHDKITTEGQRLVFDFKIPKPVQAYRPEEAEDTEEAREQLAYRRKVAAATSKAKWLAATGALPNRKK